MSFLSPNVKDKLKNNSASPPDESWVFIREKLDVNRFSKKKIWLVAASLFFIFFVGWWSFDFIQKHHKTHSVQQKNQAKISDSKIGNTEIEKKSKALKNYSDSIQSSSYVLTPNSTSEIESSHHHQSSAADNKNIPIPPQENNKTPQNESLAAFITEFEPKDFVFITKGTFDFKKRQNLLAEKNLADLNDEIFAELELEKENVTEEKEKAKKPQKFYLAGYSGSWNVFNQSSPLVSSDFKDFGRESKNSLEFGLLFTFSPASGWEFSSGIGLLDITQQTKKAPIKLAYFINKVKVDDRISSSQTHSPDELKQNLNELSSSTQSLNHSLSGVLSQDLRYIQIPVELAYRFFNSERWNFNIVAGSNLLFLQKNDIQLKYLEKEKSLQLPDTKERFSYNLKIGSKINYQITPQFGLYLQPEMAHFISSSSETQSNLLFGIKTGIFLGF